MKNLLKDWTLFEKIWLALFTVITIGLSIYFEDTMVAAVASLTGMISVVLVAKGKISNYYFGIINIALYSWISYQHEVFGELMLNLAFFLPMNIIGLVLWTKRNKKKQVEETKEGFDVQVAVLTKKTKVIWAALAVVTIIPYAYLLQEIGGRIPLLDSITTVLQVIAMVWMVQRFKEQWSLWIVVNVLNIILWVYAFATSGDDVAILVMWVAYLFNSVYGYWKWNKAQKQEIKGGN